MRSDVTIHVPKHHMTQEINHRIITSAMDELDYLHKLRKVYYLSLFCYKVLLKCAIWQDNNELREQRTCDPAKSCLLM